MEVRRLHKTMQCAFLYVHLSEAINGRSPIIENQTIQAKYTTTNRCVEKHIYNNIYGLIKDTGPVKQQTSKHCPGDPGSHCEEKSL